MSKKDGDNILRVKITFTEPVLGTAPADSDIYTRFVGSKAPDADSISDEVAALGADAIAERGMTIFPREELTEDGEKLVFPFFWDYQIKGYFKGAAQALKKVPGTKSASVKAYKKIIDTLIFPTPRRIPIIFDGEIGTCQRPLRASTPQGERVSLACSEEIPAGASCTFFVECLDPSMMDLVKEWLDYGKYSGIGQWRNSGKGRFVWDELPTEN